MDRFEAPYAEPDEAVVARLVDDARLDEAVQRRADRTATKLIEGIRARSSGVGSLEDFLREYGLSTKEGLALMAMAEALLRVPDAATQDALIADKIGRSDWSKGSDTWLVSAATWGLGVSTRLIGPGETPSGVLRTVVRRVGAPGRAPGRARGHALPRPSVRAGAHHRGGVEAARGPWRRAATATPTTCWAKARGPGPTRGATPTAYREATEAIGRAAGNKPPARPARHLGEALGAASALRGAPRGTR